MDVVVAFVSQKGGVGKCTLAWEAAAGAFLSRGRGLGYAAGEQGTPVNWQRRRLEGGCEPSVFVESCRNAGTALSVRDAYDLLVLDGPARASAATLDIARAADLWCSPQERVLDDLELRPFDNPKMKIIAPARCSSRKSQGDDQPDCGLTSISMNWFLPPNLTTVHP